MAANKTSSSAAERQRTNSQIEADLVATRQRLVAAVETLIDQVHPQRIKRRAIDDVKQLVGTGVENAKSLVFNARGDLRTNRVAVAGGALVGAIAFVAIVRRLARGGRGG